jgi:hypothetical protein
MQQSEGPEYTQERNALLNLVSMTKLKRLERMVEDEKSIAFFKESTSDVINIQNRFSFKVDHYGKTRERRLSDDIR